MQTNRCTTWGGRSAFGTRQSTTRLQNQRQNLPRIARMHTDRTDKTLRDEFSIQHFSSVPIRVNPCPRVRAIRGGFCSWFCSCF